MFRVLWVTAAVTCEVHESGGEPRLEEDVIQDRIRICKSMRLMASTPESGLKGIKYFLKSTGAATIWNNNHEAYSYNCKLYIHACVGRLNLSEE